MRYEFDGDYITFTRSNKKLQETTDVRWFIFSLPAVQTCPYSTESCRNACYAKKAERMYPSVRESRQNNLDVLNRDIWKFLYMVENAVMREHRLAKKAGKRLIVRWHESGDFFSHKYMRAWLNSMRYLTFILPDLTVTAYTKSVEYLEGLCYDRYIDRGINIIFSLWDDTPTKAWSTAQNLGLPFYTACSAEAYDNMPTIHQCPCDDCSKCLKCYDNIPKMLYCKIH